MTDAQILARLHEIQVALLRDYNGYARPGLSEAARRRASDLVALLRRDIKKAPAPLPGRGQTDIFDNDQTGRREA